MPRNGRHEFLARASSDAPAQRGVPREHLLTAGAHYSVPCFEHVRSKLRAQTRRDFWRLAKLLSVVPSFEASGQCGRTFAFPCVAVRCPAGGHRLAGATDKVALLGWGLLAGRFGQNPVDAREQVLRALNRALACPYLLDQLVTLSTEFVQMFMRPFDLVVH